jgi:kynureninase
MTAAAPLSEVEVARWREAFPILSRCTYLINNSLGAMPATVPASLQEYADEWATLGVEAWTRAWLPEVRRICDLLGSLIGAPPGTVVVHQNVATLTSQVLSALDLTGPRRKVVVTDVEWPSHRYLLAGYEALGLTVDVVPTDGVGVDTARLLEAIDERTLLVPVSHVVYRSAFVNDVADICRRAREVGALSLVDGYHAVGHLPVDVMALGCDFYVGGSVKWLCGGPGVAYLHIRPELVPELRPREVGWLGHARPFAFEPEWDPAEGALGWLGGTPSIPALYAAREGYRMVAEVTPARIRATCAPLTQRLVEGALERGFDLNSPVESARRGGAVTIDLGAETDAAARRLIERGIVVDHRPGAGIRVGPHFFNTAEECDVLLTALSEQEGSDGVRAPR